MTSWKKEIADRLRVPNIEEALFNVGWDALDTGNLQQALLSGASRDADKKFLQAVFNACGFKPPFMPAEPNLSQEVQAGLYAEYGERYWYRLWDKDLEAKWVKHSKAFEPVHVRRKRSAAMHNWMKQYDERAVALVLYGHDIDEYIPVELTGRTYNRSWQSQITYVDFWWGLYHDTFRSDEEEPIESFRGPYAIFSNFTMAPVKYEGMSFLSVESAFQAAKTTDLNERAKFIPLDSSAAKKLGRRVLLRDDWEQIKENVMFDLLMQKFSYGTAPYQILKSTAPRPLKEGNTWHDNVWGDCTCPKCSGIRGRNILGNLLMRVRDMPLVEKALYESAKERFALILPDTWRDILLEDAEFLKALLEQYRCTGILISHGEEKVLYHLTTEDRVDKILAEGFKPSGNENNTFDGDVIYSYPDMRLKDKGVLLEVRVMYYWESVYTEDKPEWEQGECIFFPSAVKSIRRV